jgi:hypothetical protein
MARLILKRFFRSIITYQSSAGAKNDAMAIENSNIQKPESSLFPLLKYIIIVWSPTGRLYNPNNNERFV